MFSFSKRYIYIYIYTNVLFSKTPGKYIKKSLLINALHVW
jgi:hypothetical protein